MYFVAADRGAGVVIVNLGKVIGARVVVLRLAIRSLIIIRSFEVFKSAIALFLESPAIAAFPFIDAAKALSGIPTKLSAFAGGAGAATTGSLEFVDDGAAAPTVGSGVEEALCRFCLRITRCLLSSSVFPFTSRKKRSLADSCIRSSYSSPLASHSFFMSAMH